MDIVNATCNPSSKNAFHVTSLLFIPEHMAVFQVLLCFCASVVFAVLCAEIFFFLRQQLSSGLTPAKLFCLYNMQLFKLLLLAVATLVRAIWAIEPYPPLDSYATGTNSSHYATKEFLLRLPQVIIVIVILMQITAWRAVVDNSTKFRRASISAPTTMDKVVSSISTAMVLILVIISLVEFLVCRGCNLILYTVFSYSVVLIPAAFFYARKLRQIISSMNFGSGSSGSLRKWRAVSKVAVVQQGVYELIFSSAVLLLALILILALNPKLCKKGHYKEESLKFFWYMVTVHVAELSTCTALFKSLRDLRTKGKSPEAAVDGEEKSRVGTHLDDIDTGIPSKI